MHTNCIVCHTHTDNIDPDFRGPFCGQPWCVQQMDYAWNGIQNARVFYRSLFMNPDGTERDKPLNILRGIKTTPDFYKFVQAGRYSK